MIMNRHRKRTPAHRLLLAVFVAALLAFPFAFAQQAAAKSYPDIGNQPAEIQQAIDYVTNKGYMNGGADGAFHAGDPIGRLEYACAMVKLFKNADEQADTAMVFKDIPAADPNFRYASIAVRYGYITPYPDGTFRPYDAQTTAAALAGLDQGLGLSAQVDAARGFWPDGPAYLGASIVAHDLHLVYSNTQTWPTRPYPRGEMAYSMQHADDVDGWRVDYVKSTFDRLKCQRPPVTPHRKQALDAAFSKIGYPYVWGGESDAEGGYDCSGLTYYVLETIVGLPMNRVADDQAKDPRYRSLSREELLPGDPIFFLKDPGKSDYVGHAGMYVGEGLFIHSTGSNAGVSVDSLSGYYADHFACGKRVIAEGAPETFDTYILLANPGDTPARARITYMLRDSRRIPLEVALDAHSRKTVKMNDTLLNEEASTLVETLEGQVVAERSMYFRYKNTYPGGHCSTGAASTSNSWFLAEGCTAYGFDTYVLVQNPGSETAQVKMTFLKDGGKTQELNFAVAPASRYTVPVDSIPGMETAEFSTQVTSTKPVVVERSMYFDYHGIKEGSNSGGVTALSPEWFFAEGYTGGGFDTFILLANPGATTARATLTLQSDDGLRNDVYVEVPARSRKTVQIDNIKGWENKSFSTRVRADVQIAAERAMYFNYNGITGGHAAFGSPALSDRWFLAEGYTGGSFDTYVLISNPNRQAVNVSVRFAKNGGGFVDKVYRVAPESRFTIMENKVKGLENSEVSASVSSTLPVVVERSMYFKYDGRSGGSCEHGVSAPSPRWYFAEGYTGM